MTAPPTRTSGTDRVAGVFAACGALACAIAVALAAYAAHGATDVAQPRLAQAAVFLFAHGLTLVALAPQAVRRLARIALAMLLLGVVLFSGSLALAVFFDTSTALAPFGGMLLMLGWLVYAADALRR